MENVLSKRIFWLGAGGIALLFCACFLLVHAVKLMLRGLKTHEETRPTPPPDPVYYLVEKKKKRTTARYQEPKEIKFK